MNPEDLRLECLRLAQAANVPADKSEVIDRARAYADFVIGARDAEVISAALELARKVA
jgi:hypothetical protein